MTRQDPEEFSVRGMQARLENAYIEQYLNSLGYSQASLKNLPEAQAKQLMCAASLFASFKLTEVEARSHLVKDMHGGTPPL
jgi:hypothetical protein